MANVPADLPPPLRGLVDMLGPASVAYMLGLVEPVWSEDVGRLRRAVADGAEGAIRDATHKLKGSAGMFGFTELAAAAESIERSAARGAALEPDLAALEALVEAAVQRVQGWVAELA